MTLPASLRTRHRLSLTWRVIALSSLLLVGLVVLFTWLGHDNLTRQFQESRHQHHERQQREIRLALQRSAENLRQLAGLAAASPRLGPPLAEGNAEDVEEALASQWPTLQLEAGIDEIRVVDTQGQTMGRWGADKASAFSELYPGLEPGQLLDDPDATIYASEWEAARADSFDPKYKAA